MAYNILKSSIKHVAPVTENLIEFACKALRQNANLKLIANAETQATWTGKQLERSITSVATYLIQDCKLNKGETCLIFTESNDFAPVLILGVISAGGICSFYDSTRYEIRGICDSIKFVDTKVLITTNKLLAKDPKQLFATVNSFENLTVLSCDQIPPCSQYKEFVHFDTNDKCKSIKQHLTHEPPVAMTFEQLSQRANIQPEKDIAIVQYSSGTTGKPKPIPRTHKNLCHLQASVDHEELMHMKAGHDVILGSLPLAHRPGIWAMLACMTNGSLFVIQKNAAIIENCFKYIDYFKATILSCSLPMLAELANKGSSIKNKYDLSSLEHIITSGSKIVNYDLPNEVVRLFKLKSLRQCFGMTEAGWVFLIEQSLAKDNYMTVGHAVPGMEVAVLDQKTNRPLGAQQRGELALRGPQVFPGYLTDKPELYNRSDFVEGDNWFKTGDQVYYDDNALVYIEGRYKEFMIFSNNLRTFPNEIEAVICEHPGVSDACVLRSDIHKGQTTYDIARAYVILKSGQSVTANQVVDFINERTVGVELKGGVIFVHEFPRLPSGKVDKKSLLDISSS